MSRGIRQVCEVQRALTVWIFLGEYPHFVTFGGHGNANAGFSLNLNEYDLFEKFIHTRIKEYTYSVKKKNTLVIDDEELSLKTIQSLDILRPFGPGFVFPSFEIVHQKLKVYMIFKIINIASIL